jgi:hypothetical protein
VRACVHRDECSYVYEYLCLYCVSQKKRLTSNKAFTNKLWNTDKFLLQNMPDRSDAAAWDTLLGNKVHHQINIMHMMHTIVLRFILLLIFL